jgi:hypothetical protein
LLVLVAILAGIAAAAWLFGLLTPR